MKSGRNISSNQLYHIVNRGVSKRRIFIDERDYRYFMFLISKYKKKYSVFIKAYCIMPTHFHLLLSSKEKSSNIFLYMKYLQYSYARYFNRNYVHGGHVFQGTYKSSYVDLYDIPKVLTYINNNPVRKKLVKHSEDWAYRG